MLKLNYGKLKNKRLKNINPVLRTQQIHSLTTEKPYLEMKKLRKQQNHKETQAQKKHLNLKDDEALKEDTAQLCTQCSTENGIWQRCELIAQHNNISGREVDTNMSTYGQTNTTHTGMPTHVNRSSWKWNKLQCSCWANDTVWYLIKWVLSGISFCWGPVVVILYFKR